MELLGRQPCDLVLLDIAMPGTNGLQLLQTLRDTPATRSIPVMMLTGFTDPKMTELSQLLGATGYLVKGKFEWDDFHRRIVDVPAGRRLTCRIPGNGRILQYQQLHGIQPEMKELEICIRSFDSTCKRNRESAAELEVAQTVRFFHAFKTAAQALGLRTFVCCSSRFLPLAPTEHA